MPKADPLVPATRDTFNHMRLQAMLAPPSDALQVENNDLMWADFGRRIYANIEDRERFLRAIVTASLAAEKVPHPQAEFMRRLKVYLVTGTIA